MTPCRDLNDGGALPGRGTSGYQSGESDGGGKNERNGAEGGSEVWRLHEGKRSRKGQ